MENPHAESMCLEKSKEIAKLTNLVKNTQFRKSTDHFLSENFNSEINEKSFDVIDMKWTDDSNITLSSKSMDSDQSEHVGSIKDNYKIKIKLTPSGNQLFRVLKNPKTNTTNMQRTTMKTNTIKNHKRFDKSRVCVKPIIGNLPAVQINVKSEFEQKYEDNEKVCLKFEKYGRTYKVKCPLVKTRSGSIAININTSKLLGELKSKHKESPVVLTRSDSDAFFLSEHIDGYSNAVIKKTASDAFIVILTDTVIQCRGNVKKIGLSKKSIVKISKNINSDQTEISAALSQNDIIVPSIKHKHSYKETVKDMIRNRTEYYINLTQKYSQDRINHVNNSCEINKPKALVIKSDSADVNIVNNKQKPVSLDVEHKVTLSTDTSTSGECSPLSNNLTKESNVYSKTSSTSSKKSPVRQKSSSDSNVYQKIKLFYSDHKDLLENSSSIIKMTKSGENTVVLDKESKISFINNLRNYLKHHQQGLVPIKRTSSGEITIALNGEHSTKNRYGSLKITTSGNLFVMVNKDLIKKMQTDEESLCTSTTNNNMSEETSRHIIRKIKRPVNKAVTTTCNAMPGSDCDVSQCTCDDSRLKNVDWILNKEKTINFFGINARKVTSNLSVTHKNFDEKCTEYDDIFLTSNDKALPHIIIKPCADEKSLTASDNQQQCFYVVEGLCPFSENFSCWAGFAPANNSKWDSLNFLPPQLPDFLKDIKY